MEQKRDQVSNRKIGPERVPPPRLRSLLGGRIISSQVFIRPHERLRCSNPLRKPRRVTHGQLVVNAMVPTDYFGGPTGLDRKSVV